MDLNLNLAPEPNVRTQLIAHSFGPLKIGSQLGPCSRESEYLKPPFAFEWKVKWSGLLTIRLLLPQAGHPKQGETSENVSSSRFKMTSSTLGNLRLYV